MNNNKLCENKKWELVNFCEFDKYAEKSYCAIHNIDENKNLGDITKVDETKLSPFNMICGGSPCFVAGTKVITKEGYKNIENIKTGDMVLTHKNRFMPVLKTGGDTNKDIYKLKVQGFLETECTDYHPFYCKKTKDSEPEKIKLKNIKKGYYVGSHINTKFENQYNLSDEDCWILGRYVADGHIRKDKRKNRKSSYQYQCILSIGSDKVDELKGIVKNRHYSCYPHTKSTHRVVFSSIELVEFIIRHNFGNGAENKTIPNFILNLPVHKLKYFLDGYMAGDGCNIGNIYQATTVSKELAMSLCLVIQKVYHVGCCIYYDERPDTCIIENRVVNQKDTYMIRFRKNPQKHSWFIRDDIVWYPIREISKTDKVENVYNIEVEEDHTYTANNIITFNCQDFSVAGKQKGSIWTCKDCSHEYNPLTVHWSERDKCPHCGSTNLEKTRSSLLVEYLRVIRANKPNFGIYENVKNIVGKQFKETTFKLFTDELEEYGYNVYQEQLSKYQEKNIDLAKAHGDYEKSSDYDVKISNTQAERAIKQNELDELTKQLNDGVEAGTIVENSQEWLDMQTKIKEAQNAVADYDTQIEELKQSQIGVYYEEQFERAAEKVDRFRDKLDGLKSLISDDMKIDKNTGLLTESGALSITLDVDDINASTENLKTYIKERQQIINDYNAGKFGEDEYNQKLKDVDANIKSTTANIYSSRNSILELVKSQSQAELDVLNKVIDKRKEALSAKKSYYDYDKTLKNKTKDIEVLERQIAALEGSTSAEDKARKAKLQEQLQSAKDDLNDTIVDHAYSMQTDLLDKLSTDLSEDLDTWINKISSNMEEMTNAINGAISNAGLSTASTINAISSILRHYGLSDSEISQSGLTNITGYASGTDYVPKSGMYRVNENGMESVFSKQYGTLTFLNQGDKVFDANFTKSLLDNATIATQKNMPDYAGMAKAIEKNIQNIQNLSGNTYVNNFYIDGAQDTESILREIDKHLDKKIQAHDKKQVRDFKSLR